MLAKFMPFEEIVLFPTDILVCFSGIYVDFLEIAFSFLQASFSQGEMGFEVKLGI
jgi:hypothetical protein